MAMCPSRCSHEKCADHRTGAGAPRRSCRARTGNEGAVLPPPATGIQPSHQEIMDKLSTASGRAFDRADLDAQLNAHKEAVELFSTYAREGDNPELKHFHFAQQMLPTLEEHLKHAILVRLVRTWGTSRPRQTRIGDLPLTRAEQRESDRLRACAACGACVPRGRCRCRRRDRCCRR
jgi:hypothetical protein